MCLSELPPLAWTGGGYEAMGSAGAAYLLSNSVGLR